MSLIKLQQKIGATPDGSFGPNTLKKAMAYFKITAEQAAHFFGQKLVGLMYSVKT